MKIKQIGNGGAFDVNQTNSSFIIDVTEKDIERNSGKKTYLLFDCGYNVFDTLMKEYSDILKDLDYVYISHMDDDHMGSLKTLLYYRYYILGKTTMILANPGITNLIQYLKGINVERKFGELCKAPIVEIVGEISGFVINYVKCSHHIETYGLVIGEIAKVHSTTSCKFPISSLLYISGDTKVNANTIDTIEHIYNNAYEPIITDLSKNPESIDLLNQIKALNTSIKIFHDYSKAENYDQQNHTCEYDFNKYYSKYTKNNYMEINKYHTGTDEYDTGWQDMNGCFTDLKLSGLFLETGSYYSSLDTSHLIVSYNKELL